MANSLLLGALLILLVVEPFMPESTLGRVVFDLIVSAVLITAVWAVSRRPGLLLTGLLLAAPGFGVRWALYVVDSHGLEILGVGFYIAFFTFVALVVLWQALEHRRVTAHTITGAISVYLLLSVIWALAFSAIELAHPGSFLIEGRRLEASDHPGRSLAPELFYLSLASLTAVGYGDILPVTNPARRFAVLEAVVGQLYLAVLIARLVGLRVPRSRPGT
jgi:ion channel